MNLCQKLAIVALLVATSLVGVMAGSNLVSPQPSIDLIVLGEHEYAYSLYWEKEVARRYDNAVIILGHGGPEDYMGPWAIRDSYTDDLIPMTEVVDRVRERHPGRRIVIISCNPWHQYLDRKNVTYALEDVWFYPDAMLLQPLNEVYPDHPGVGDIMDFIEQ